MAAFILTPRSSVSAPGARRANRSGALPDFEPLDENKRGVMGSYHSVSKKYLPLYLAEFQFRFNTVD
jgi:transposase-like protein